MPGMPGVSEMPEMPLETITVKMVTEVAADSLRGLQVPLRVSNISPLVSQPLTFIPAGNPQSPAGPSETSSGIGKQLLPAVLSPVNTPRRRLRHISMHHLHGRGQGGDQRPLCSMRSPRVLSAVHMAVALSRGADVPALSHPHQVYHNAASWICVVVLCQCPG
jgi:hypothetical protein